MNTFNRKNTVKVNDITQMDNDITFLDYLDLRADIEHMLTDGSDLEEIEISMRILEKKKRDLLEVFTFRMDEDTKEMVREINTRRMFKDMGDNLEECKRVLTAMNEQNQAIIDAYNTMDKVGE